MATTIGSLDLNAFSDLYNDSTQYFWFESNASATYGAGAHVTLVPDTSFISNPTGQNILMNTDGFSIRNGLLPMMTLDNNSLDFNVVDTTAGTYVTTATFTATGAQIGQSGSAHSVIDANGQRFYGGSDGTTQLANIGYGEGQAQTGTAIAPYYTLGTRASNSIIGNYSMAEGVNTEASDWCSHAEGYATKAYYTCAHSEGYATKASQHAAHAEGAQTIASGRSSHAQNNATIAQRLSQTAIGEYNIADTSGGNESVRGDYVLIIGNGTAVSARSNALTVDWDGDVDLPTGKFSGVGATLTYNASNSGTNALEINNASSNALTVDWSGNLWAENYYPVGSVYIHQDNTNPADILGFGTWTRIHRCFRYNIIENPVTFNSTNVNTGTNTGSVCIIDGDTVYLRLTVQTRVVLNDSTIEIGTLDFSKIGLTTCYYGQFPFLTDGGNGIAMFSINNQNGVIKSEDVITKASNGTIAAGAIGYCMIPILFGRDSMLDSFCDEFHWRRTA